MNYYDRQILLWGEQTQSTLSTKSVAIIGCGGLGNSIALALSGVGLHSIYLIDFDIVEIHNIHRQVCFDFTDDQKCKAAVLATKLSLRNNQTKFIPYNISFDEFIKLNKQYDLLIDATDSLDVRTTINTFAKAQTLPWIYSSVEEFNAQICLFKNSSFDSFNIRSNEPKGISAPMVMQAASLSANLATRYLANLSVEYDILNYIYYDNFGKFHLRSFNI